MIQPATGAPAITTAEQLLRAPDLGRCELVAGELTAMSPAGFDHGRIAGTVVGLLSRHVAHHKLGAVTGAETGFVLARNPDTVRAPDAAFVRADRVPGGPVPGFFDGAPDFAAEVLSPDDRASEVAAKVQMWLSHGCRLVWVIDPKTRLVTAYHDDGTARLYREGDAIDAGEVVPGFRVQVAELFPPEA